MRNLSFSSRLFVLTATLLAASVVVGVIGIVGLGRTNAGLETVYNDRVIPLRQLKQIADAYAVSVIDAANKANAGLMSAEETRAAVTAAQGVIASNWKAYMATTLTTEEAQLAQQAEGLFRAADASVAQLLTRLDGRTGSLAGTFGDFDGPLYATIDPISNKIGELVELQLRVAQIEYEAAQARYASVRAFAIGAVVLILLLGGAFGWLLSRDVSATLHHVSRQLREGAEQVVAASSQVATAAQTLSEGSTEQAASLEETSASMEEMASMTRRNAANAQSAAGLMLEVDRRVQASNQSLGDMVASMHAIQESSQKVSKIIKTIDEIAFQTNILALNAAVEAARAGEAGARASRWSPRGAHAGAALGAGGARHGEPHRGVDEPDVARHVDGDAGGHGHRRHHRERDDGQGAGRRRQLGERGAVAGARPGDARDCADGEGDADDGGDGRRERGGERGAERAGREFDGGGQRAAGAGGWRGACCGAGGVARPQGGAHATAGGAQGSADERPSRGSGRRARRRARRDGDVRLVLTRRGGHIFHCSKTQDLTPVPGLEKCCNERCDPPRTTAAGDDGRRRRRRRRPAAATSPAPAHAAPAARRR